MGYVAWLDMKKSPDSRIWRALKLILDVSCAAELLRVLYCGRIPCLNHEKVIGKGVVDMK